MVFRALKGGGFRFMFFEQAGLSNEQSLLAALFTCPHFMPSAITSGLARSSLLAEGHMSRSEGIQNNQAGPVTRFIFFLAKRYLGRVPLGTRIRAFDPKFLRHALRLDLYSASKGVVPVHLKELAQLKTALMVGCPF